MNDHTLQPHNVTALSGGVGGARLLHGLAAVLSPEALTIIANTGDDFEHWGLRVCPDVDTILYTLAGVGHVTRGWGLADETFQTLERVAKLGGPDWFRIGDRDLATHLTRAGLLAQGKSLAEVTDHLRRHLGVAQRILPMSNHPRPTIIHTPDHGPLIFQDWFVLHRARPSSAQISFEGTPEAAPGVLEAIQQADVVIFGPSNPFVSIDPILSLDGVRESLAAKTVVAVSPIVGGKAVKGPLAEMLLQRGKTPSPQAIVDHYQGLLSGIVIERGDTPPDIPHLSTDTVMRSLDDRQALAKSTLEFTLGLAGDTL